MNSINRIFRLEDRVVNDVARPVPLGVKTTPTTERASLEELEDAYIHDATVNNGVNKAVSVIMSANHHFEGSDEAVSLALDFVDSIGTKGGNTGWRRLLELTFKHQCVYGRASQEKIFGATSGKLLDLDFVDPKKIDYAKDDMKKIVLDKHSNPVGWIETLPMVETLDGGKLKSDVPPPGVQKDSNQIFFKPSRIVHFKFTEIGDGFYGLGMVEPILNVSKWKRTMLEAITNVYYRAGFPRNVFIVGDAQHEPTNDLLQQTVEEINKASYKSSFAVPNYVKPEMLEAKNTHRLREHLRFFIEEQIMVLGPRTFVTGSGEEMNKSTLNRLEFLYKLTLKDLINRTVDEMNKHVFKPLAEMNGLKDAPRLVWGEINLEELDNRADRLKVYTDSGFLTPTIEDEKQIRELEGLPENGEPKVVEGGE